MQHEFRYGGETYDVLLERTPKIWTFANHCAHLTKMDEFESTSKMEQEHGPI